jgi:glycosyltransferase involved in cell wall biosynthesis
MLRKPIPWLVRTAPVVDRRARRLRARALSALARSQLGGELVAPALELAAHLARAAPRRLLPGAALTEIARANLAAHGPEQLAAAARAALASLGAGDRARLARAVARALEEVGHIQLPLALLAAAGLPRARLELHARLLDQGVPPAAPIARGWAPAPRRVLYHAAQSLPHLSSGYAIRTHWLARSLRESGWDLTVVNRLGYPNDRLDHIGVSQVERAAVIDGVPYRFRPTARRGGMLGLSIADYQAAAAAAVIEEAAELRPALIHSASNFAVGLAGCEAARRLGVPSVFEVRGLWHMSRAADQPAYQGSDHYRMLEGLEAQAARMADHVFVITEAVADILAARGVERGKMSILPNAVDLAAFARRPRDPELALRWGLNDKLVAGYVGTFKDYEGLDLLLAAMAELRGELGDRARLLLVGDGPAEGELHRLVRRLGLADLVVFTGRVPHGDIPTYQALIDVMVFPRRGAAVCEVVSPIKPFEAMASGVPILASDVAALAEIVEDEVTGLLHRKDDVAHLCAQLMRLLEEPDLRSFLAGRAEEWVRAHRSWSAVAAHVSSVYQLLIGAPQAA